MLQHMNQPNGLCYGSSPLFGEYDNPVDGIAADSVAPRSPNAVQFQQEEYEPGLHEDHVPYGDFEMNDVASNPPNDPPISVPPRPEVEQLSSERFVETFKGCGESFPGGKTFMDDFWIDQYAEQRHENIYYPWASKQEWVFASWLLRSRLSMASIDSLLSLDIVSNNVQLHSFTL